jgi:subtilisin family serine protease
MSHVLTVAATDEHDVAASFSSSSAGVDLAAPGVDIPVAVPLQYDPSGYKTLAGTSFSAPIVSGATAWVWTARPGLDNTQMFDLMRWSARDVGPPGFDEATGFGILDVPTALTMAAPARDPLEPNDNIYLVKPGGLFATGQPAVTTPAKPSASLSARLDVTEDPRDVYRVFVPAHKTVALQVRGSENLDLQLWKPTTKSVLETGAAQKRDLAGTSARPGLAPRLSVANTSSHGGYYYANVFLGHGVGTAEYTLSITTRASARR